MSIRFSLMVVFTSHLLVLGNFGFYFSPVHLNSNRKYGVRLFIYIFIYILKNVCAEFTTKHIREFENTNLSAGTSWETDHYMHINPL